MQLRLSLVHYMSHHGTDELNCVGSTTDPLSAAFTGLYVRDLLNQSYEAHLYAYDDID